MRITGQLIDASTGAHVWADRFDGALEDVFDLQDRVTSQRCRRDCTETRAGRDRARQAKADRESSMPTTAICAALAATLRALTEAQRSDCAAFTEALRA